MRLLPSWLIALVAVNAVIWVHVMSTGGSRFDVLGFVIVWTLAPLPIVVPYCRRLGGFLSDYVLSVGWLVFIFVLPILPFFFGPVEDAMDRLFPTSIILVVLWMRLGGSLRQQGYYFDTDRPLPGLSNERRELAAGVLAAAGLRLESVRVGPLGAINALVQGIRHCTVVVDPDATKRLSDGEFRALLAHEAGHVRLGGVLLTESVFPVYLAVLNAVASAGLVDREVGAVAPIVAALVVVMLVNQCVEFYCDRYAARLTSPEEAASVLRKMRDELPDRVRRFATAGWLCVLSSHPPFGARLAALGRADRGLFARYAALVVAVVLVLFVVPWALLLVAPRASAATSGLLAESGELLLLVYPALWLIAQARFQKRSEEIHPTVDLGTSPRSVLRWARPALYGSVVLLAAAAVLFPALPEDTAFLFLGASFFAVVSFVIANVAIGVRRWVRAYTPARIRRAAAELAAVLVEGKTGEALRRVDGLPAEDLAHPVIGYLRALTLLQIGRPGDAEDVATDVLEKEPGFFEAIEVLVIALVLRDEIESARRRLDEIGEAAAARVDFWLLSALVNQEEKNLEEADRCCARALEIAPKDVRALTGRALAAMERDGAGDVARRWLDRVDPAERGDAIVLLAEARWSRLGGRVDESAGLFRRSLKRLDEDGLPGYRVLYERRARRWGIPVERSGDSGA